MFLIYLCASVTIGSMSNVLWYYIVPYFRLVLILFYGIPSIVILVWMVLFLKDTPISLLTKYTAREAHTALSFIAKINKKENFKMTE